MARGRQPGFRMGAEHRTKIGNSKILKELVRFAEGEISPEEYPPHRVTAALGLLRKVMPDLTHNEHANDPDNPLTRPDELTDAELARIAAAGSAGIAEAPTSKGKPH